jgi:Na+-driven multidrug efflux pump
VVLAVGFSALFAVIFLFGGGSIFKLLGGRDTVLREVMAYSDVLFSGILVLWLFNILGSIIRGVGQMKVAALWMVVASAIQIVAGGLLILGIGPFPELGIVGAAVAALMGYGIATVGQLLYLTGSGSGITLRFRGIPLARRYFAAILRIGLVASIGPLSSVGAIIVITGFVARMGDAALAGYGIGSRLEFLMIPLIFGIGAACITLIGLHFGAGEIERAHRIGWTGGVASAAIAGAIGLVLAIFPSLWADLFSDNEIVREACRTYLRIVGPTYAFFGLGLCLYFGSQGAGRVFWPALGNAARFAIILVGGLIMYATSQVTVESLFVLVAVGMVAYGGIIAGLVKLGAWRSGERLPQGARLGAD